MNPPRSEGSRPPQGTMMQMVMGAWVAQAIASVTRLDIPDLLLQHGPLTARQLTEKHGLDAKADFLQRALRACAGAGVFTEDAEGRFGSTPLSEVLTLDSPVSVKRFVELIGGSWWKLFSALPDAFRTGQNQSKSQLGMEFWEFASSKEMEDFGEAMQSRVDSTLGVVERFDFSRAQTLVDVGGGFGHVAIALLQRHSRLHAIVLERPALIAVAKRHASEQDPETLARLSFVGGDMFADVPSGDTYLLKAILHSWEDERCIRVLQRCCHRMQGDGRIVCVDNILPPMGDTRAISTKLLDLLMMVSSPGRERTEAEWRFLYGAAGLEVASIAPINPFTGESIIEGVKRRTGAGAASIGPAL